MSKLKFKKMIIGEVNNDFPPAPMNTFSTIGDINCDGRLDFVLSGRDGRMVWLENPGLDQAWQAHLIDEVQMMECGGCLVDLTGNGYPDIINGGDWRSDEIFWWENTGRWDRKWTRRLIASTGNRQFHDTLIGDVSGDGRLSLIFTNQGNGTNIYCIPLPQDPTVSPWRGLVQVVSHKTEANPASANGRQPEEGLAIGDVDGDGKNEIVCGTHWYKYVSDQWQEHKFAAGYITTKVAIGDVDGDGRNEIVLSEGDPYVYGKTQGGRLGWFKPKENPNEMWEEHIIADGLLDAHSLQLGNLCGNGHLDVFVAEVGVADKDDRYVHRAPRLMVFENDGDGHFTTHIIDEGSGTHEALLVDIFNRGILDIAGKPLHGVEKWKIHVWRNMNANQPDK